MCTVEFNKFLQVQLAITTAIISLFVFHAPTIVFVQNNVWFYWASIIALFVILIMLACCENLRRNSPVNFILLFIFTGCMSLVLGVTCAFFDTWEVMLAGEKFYADFFARNNK